MRKCFFAVPLIAMLSISGLLAQSDTAQISGFVLDPSGAGVPNARVTIVNESTLAERRAVTNEQGYYAISALPPGFYTVTAEASGFKKLQKSQNKLDANIASTVNLPIEVGTTSEVVEVTAAVGTVQSDSSTLGKLIEASQIRLMQLNGRNPLYLASLKPGVRSRDSLARFGFGLDRFQYKRGAVSRQPYYVRWGRCHSHARGWDEHRCG